MDKLAPVERPIHDVLARRWSPRAFAAALVRDDQILTLLEAARWAPSAFNAQPWRYLVASRQRPETFATMLGCLMEANQLWAQHAAVLMIAVASARFTHNDKHNLHAWHDVGMANAMLAVQATSMGLYTHFMAGFDADKTRTTFAIPDAFEPVAAVAIGYPGDAHALPEPLRQRELAPRSRMELDDMVYEGTWQGRFSGLDDQ